MNKIKLNSYSNDSKKSAFRKKTYKPKKPLSEIEYDYKKLYNYAINRLSSRDYSRKELFDKMNRFKTEPGDIDKALDKVQELGYISDERRAKSIINTYKNKESIFKIQKRLMDKGISKSLIDEIFSEKTDDTESVILTLLSKKFKTYNKDNWDKMVRFLASKGFKYNDISKGIKNFSEEQ